MISQPAHTNLSRRKRGRLRSAIVWALVIAAGLAVLTGGLYIAENVRSEAAWRGYERDARARGVKLTLAEIVPPRIPDAENFAAIPLFQKAFAQPGRENPFELPQSTADAKRPRLGQIETATPIDLAAWQTFFVETGWLAAPDAHAAVGVLKALERYRAPLDQLREARSRSGSLFPVDYTKGTPATPHLSLCAGAAAVLHLRAAAHLSNGEPTEALEDVRDQARLAAALESAPSLVDGLARLTVLTHAQSAIWAGLPRRQWEQAQLETLLEELSHVRVAGDFSNRIAYERAFANWAHDTARAASIRREWLGMARIHTSGAGLNTDSAAVALALSLSPRGWIRQSQVRTNRHFDILAAQFDPGTNRFRAAPPAPTPGETGSLRGNLERARHELFYMLVPTYDSVGGAFALAETRLNQARTACAVELFRNTRGSYPERLVELVPGFLPKVPTDLMDGGELRYRLEPDRNGYVLYSVGTDLRDEGGRTDPTLSAKNQPDWIWRVPGTATTTSAESHN